MPSRDLILAIDNGTQSLRALLFDLEGTAIAKRQIPIKPYFCRQPGWAEQDPEVFWQALCRACQGLWRANSHLKSRVKGVALTTQRSTVINLGQDGRPLRPAIHWLDQRRTHGLPPLRGLWGGLFKLLRLDQTIAYFQSQAEANWIRTYQPELWKKTRKYLLLSGYLTYRLTGDFVDSIGCQVGYLPFDYRRRRWAASRDWKWQCLPMDPEWLPRLVPPTETLGVVSAQAAEQTGIPSGLPLVAAAADKACEVIGCGSLESSIGCLSYGTAATINVTHRKYVEAIPLLPPYPSAVRGAYTIEVQIYRGYWMVNWFKEEFGHPEQQMAAAMGVEAESLFDRLVENIPPGAQGLVLQPYWSPGLKLPGPEAKGAIIGFGDVHTRAHIYRAIIEGLAYALREGKERIEKRTGIPITSLRVSGGGSQSRQAMQVTADIFGLPTAKPHVYETSGLGAAIDAAVGLGYYPDFKSAVNGMTHIGEVFEPDQNRHKLYDNLYRDVYQKMYPKLKPLYERIKQITGYPL
jgi:sugar (pentulose or hexulose) kinase